MNTDLELYRAFCQVAKYKNITKAAENMFISQSALTQSIQKLETLLGRKVFYRNKFGVELTEEGKNLYEYIKDSIETMSNAENIFSKYTNLEKGKIRIGGGNSLVTSLISEPLADFIKSYPNIEISVSSGITNNLIQQLANGELDIVVLNLPYTNKKYSHVEITPLQKSSFSFFCSKKYLEKHPLENFSDISHHTLILPKAPSAKSMILDEYCKNNSLELHAKYEVSSSSVMRKMVLNDIGIGFTNTRNLTEVMNDITILKNISPENTAEGIATLKKNMCSQATLKLTSQIISYYK